MGREELDSWGTILRFPVRFSRILTEESGSLALTPSPFQGQPDWEPNTPPSVDDPRWRIFEKVVADLTAEYPDCEVLQDHKVKGQRSGIPRQVDVWVNGKVAGCEVKLVIECKCHRNKIGIKDVDAFYGFLDDVGANKGVLVATSGFTKGAEARAKGADIRLDIKDLDEAEEIDWTEYLGRNCQSWCQCWGSVNWDYSENDTRMGHCSECGEFHIHCGHCGHTATYSPDGAYASICDVHLRCESCNHCFVLGMEKGEVCDISDCTTHEP
jgi:hypothetical protein